MGITGNNTTGTGSNRTGNNNQVIRVSNINVGNRGRNDRSGIGKHEFDNIALQLC